MIKKPEEDTVEIPSSINILTYNCWGLKYLAKWRSERLTAIGRSLATNVPTPEVVGLQECWTQEDYLSIRKQTRHILPHGKFYFSGIFGGGLAILSKWPIVESNMVRYPLNGRPTAFFRGDWFVGKGVACASIQLGPGRQNMIEVFNTHLHAPYEREPSDSYLCHRTAQAWEIARLMRGAVERGHLVLGLGDFNMVPLSLAHQLITTHAPVQDVWRVLHPESSLGASSQPAERARDKGIPSARYNLQENGATCDSILNTWRWGKQQQKALFKGEVIAVDPYALDPRAKRLDYIFFGNGSSTSSDSAPWRIQSAKIGMTERHPSLNCSLSDHFSVEATITRVPKSQTFASDRLPDRRSTPEQTNDSALRALTNASLRPTLYTSYNASPTSSLLPPTLPRTPSPPTTNIPSSSSPSTARLPSGTYTEILTLVSIYKNREYRQRRLRLSHFVSSVVISIICFTGIWWSNHAGVSFMLVLVSTLNFGAGVIDGLIGGLFVGSELRALREFEWEMENAKAIAQQCEIRAELAGTVGAQDSHNNYLCLETRDDDDKMGPEEGKENREVEKELWEKVRGSEEYGGNEKIRKGSIGVT
ncbi:MAG: hypothetical protein LQ341_004665 [Variospora aurantia]|nr:MAG: hypothetical protein LQ341_004665 [Variospora aurantia]